MNEHRLTCVVVAALAAVMLLSLACGGATPVIVTPSEASPVAPGSAQASPAPSEMEPTQEPTRDTAVAPVTGGFACLATIGGDVTCLTESGWQAFDRENSTLHGHASDMAACSDGSIYFAQYASIAAFDGTEWTVYPDEGRRNWIRVACHPDGGFWVLCVDGVRGFQRGRWEDFSYTDMFLEGDHVGSTSPDLAISPDGAVWVSGWDSIAMYDGTSWREFREGDGLEERELVYRPYHLAVDSRGRVWTVSPDILVYESGEWNETGMGIGHTYSVLALDLNDRLWLGTYSDGATMYEAGTWTSYSVSSGDLSSNEIRDIDFDQAGRTWIATAYGLNVFDGSEWTVYRMDNAEIPDNRVYSVAVAGDGPELPAPLEKRPGSISGRVKQDDELPAGSALVKICVEDLGLGQSRSDQAFRRSTTTDEDGYFRFTDVPVGYYVIAVKHDLEWSQPTELFSDERIPVQEGEETDLGDLHIGKYLLRP